MDKYLQTSFLDDSQCEQTVNIQQVKRKRRKQLEINIDSAFVELNLLLLPIAPIGRVKDDVGTIVAKWKDSNDVLRGIKIAMTDGYKMINSFDIKVLNGLLKIYSEENSIIQYDFTKGMYNMPVEINYTAREVCRKIGYNSFGGSLVSRVQDSIRKLANVTITSMFEGGIYDAKNKCYVKTKGEKGFHIIEDYEMYQFAEGEKRLNTNQIREYNKVIINSFFYNSMCTGYAKVIPYDTMIKIKHDVSQRIFSLLEGWFCSKKPFVFFKYETLYMRIPLEENQPIKLKNRDIKTAVEELKKIGYIQKYIIKKGEGVYFIFDSTLDDTDILNFDKLYYGLEKYGSLPDIVQALLSYGISENDIDTYVNSSNIEYVKALLRYFDMAMRYDRIHKNPTNFLLKGLMEGYNIDKKYYN